jgi:hypothetical protein
MVSPISPADRLRRLSKLIRYATSTQSQSSTISLKAPSSTPLQENPVTVLLSRAREIPADHPERTKQVVALFIDFALRNEFTGALVLSPDYHQMVQIIADQLTESPEYAADCHALADSLQSKP